MIKCCGRLVLPLCYHHNEQEQSVDMEVERMLQAGPVLLGHHPTTMEDILLRVGPYGPYLQVGTPQSASAVLAPPKVGNLARSKKKPKSNSKPKMRARMVAIR